MDKPKYQEKRLLLLNTHQFVKLNRDPTKQIETKIRKVLKKIKINISSQGYSRLYPTGSYPGKIYGTMKIHSLLYYVSSAPLCRRCLRALRALRAFVPYAPPRLTCLDLFVP